MKFKYLLKLLLITTIVSCKPQSKYLEGTFYNKDDIFSAIYFDNKGGYSILRKYGAILDTLSVGKYSIKKNFLTLNADKKPDEYPTILKEIVDSKSSNIVIEINSPFIDDINKEGIENVLQFGAFINANTNFSLFENKNIIVIEGIRPKDIKDFHIKISFNFFDLLDKQKDLTIISNKIYPKGVGNYFKVIIPNMTEKHLNKLYLENEILKILDIKTIQWNNKIFSKYKTQWNEGNVTD